MKIEVATLITAVLSAILLGVAAAIEPSFVRGIAVAFGAYFAIAACIKP